MNHRVDELLVGLVGQIEAGHRRVEEDRVRATRLATSVGIVRDSISFPGGATGDNGFSGEGDQILGGAGLGSTPGSRKQSLRAKTGGGISRFFKRHFYRGNGDGET
ncbi:unnamed protein product [Protopolystoma xenopodis]|uniref:Uncharacterized protein n=1 Tax=Protopolystoma xenopodis TaxID=117903 RepID=A0A448XIT3_9PLAT|nr:unnamed protein product [Protopolystoma xenopodis]